MHRQRVDLSCHHFTGETATSSCPSSTNNITGKNLVGAREAATAFKPSRRLIVFSLRSSAELFHLTPSRPGSSLVERLHPSRCIPPPSSLLFWQQVFPRRGCRTEQFGSTPRQFLHRAVFLYTTVVLGQRLLSRLSQATAAPRSLPSRLRHTFVPMLLLLLIAMVRPRPLAIIRR